MEDQPLLAPLTDSLSDAGSPHQISRDHSRLHLVRIPDHHFATPHVDQEVFAMAPSLYLTADPDHILIFFV